MTAFLCGLFLLQTVFLVLVRCFLTSPHFKVLPVQTTDEALRPPVFGIGIWPNDNAIQSISVFGREIP